MIYLGTVGRMIGIKCPASQQVTPDERFTFKTTVEGLRKAQVRPTGRRTWSLQTSDATTPDEVAALMQFANGAWGRGPFWFVPADAPFANLLPPTTGVFGGHVDAGPVRLAGGGWAPFANKRSDGLAGTIQFVGAEGDPPVVPGMPVTASAWVHGASASVLLQWFSAAGTVLGSASSSGGSLNTIYSRVHVTAVAPANTAYARVTARDALGATLPAITWTDALQPYGDGQGCSKAVVHGTSRDLVLTGPGRTYSNLSFTVTEVG